MKVRKNITLSRRANEYLKLLAEEKKKSQSEVIEELIEKEMEEYVAKKRMELFEDLLKEITPYRGKIGDKTLQQIKREIGDEL